MKLAMDHCHHHHYSPAHHSDVLEAAVDPHQGAIIEFTVILVFDAFCLLVKDES
jgi:hypothetical protein